MCARGVREKMATTITPVSQYVAIRVPEAGDNRFAASVAAGFQDAGDCLKFFKDLIDGLKAGTIPFTAITVTNSIDVEDLNCESLVCTATATIDAIAVQDLTVTNAIDVEDVNCESLNVSSGIKSRVAIAGNASGVYSAANYDVVMLGEGVVLTSDWVWTIPTVGASVGSRMRVSRWNYTDAHTINVERDDVGTTNICNLSPGSDQSAELIFAEGKWQLLDA